MCVRLNSVAIIFSTFFLVVLCFNQVSVLLSRGFMHDIIVSRAYDYGNNCHIRTRCICFLRECVLNGLNTEKIVTSFVPYVCFPR